MEGKWLRFFKINAEVFGNFEIQSKTEKLLTCRRKLPEMFHATQWVSCFPVVSPFFPL